MMTGIIVAIVGVLFLLKELGYVSMVNWNLIWPVIVILVGLSMTMKRCRMCGGRGLCKDGCGKMNPPMQ